MVLFDFADIEAYDPLGNDPLSATSGVVTDTAAPLLEWNGPLGGTAAVTMTYEARVTTESTTMLLNTAAASAPGYQPVT